MPNANIIELETCIDDCIAYCEQNRSSPYAQLFHAKLSTMRTRWEKSLRLSESHHTRWRSEQREERLAWKHLSNALREAQRELHRVGAIDFPAERVLYWDEERLMIQVDRMRVYLSEHLSALDFAQPMLDKLGRHIETANTEEREADSALGDFKRFIDMRREAMNELGSTIGDFRIALRRGIGKRDPAYQKIRWPFAIASDENVLF